MLVTGNITSVDITNKVNGGSYIFYLTQDAVGGHTIPALGVSFGKATDSTLFTTVANGVNIINVNVDPDGNTFYTLVTI